MSKENPRQITQEEAYSVEESGHSLTFAQLLLPSFQSRLVAFSGCESAFQRPPIAHPLIRSPSIPCMIEEIQVRSLQARRRIKRTN